MLTLEFFTADQRKKLANLLECEVGDLDRELYSELASHPDRTEKSIQQAIPNETPENINHFVESFKAIMTGVGSEFLKRESIKN